MQKVDMNQIVGTHHILFVCIDSLRYDVALEEWQNGGTPVLNNMGRGGNVRRRAILHIHPIRRCLQVFFP